MITSQTKLLPYKTDIKMEGEIMTILIVENWQNSGLPRSHHGLKEKVIVVKGKEVLYFLIDCLATYIVLLFIYIYTNLNYNHPRG